MSIRSTILIGTVGIGVFAVVAFSITTLLADDPFTGTDHLKNQGAKEGEARKTGGDDVAFYVNGYPVKVDETLEVKARNQYSIDTWADVARRTVPDDDPRLTDEHYTHDRIYDGKSPVPASVFPTYREDYKLWARYGADTLSLGELIAKYADYTHAVSQGFSMTDGEVAGLVNEMKQKWEDGPYSRETETISPDGTPHIRIEQSRINPKAEAYLETLGKDLYWELMAERIRIQYTTGKWRETHIEQLPVKNEYTIYETVIRLNREARTSATIELAEGFPLVADVESAQRYLEELSTSFEERLADLQGSPSQP